MAAPAAGGAGAVKKVTECRCYIGLGSNLGDSRALLEAALEALGRLPESRLLAVSSFYRSRPLADMAQPDYLNAVAALATRLPAQDLLTALQAIERRHGRRRDGRRWQPRTLDLDLLLYGRQRIDTPRLIVPHPGIAERDFVVIPLAELDPELNVPGYGTIRSLMRRTPNRGLERIPR